MLQIVYLSLPKEAHQSLFLRQMRLLDAANLWILLTVFLLMQCKRTLFRTSSSTLFMWMIFTSSNRDSTLVPMKFAFFFATHMALAVGELQWCFMVMMWTSWLWWRTQWKNSPWTASPNWTEVKIALQSWAWWSTMPPSGPKNVKKAGIPTCYSHSLKVLQIFSSVRLSKN